MHNLIITAVDDYVDKVLFRKCNRCGDACLYRTKQLLTVDSRKLIRTMLHKEIFEPYLRKSFPLQARVCAVVCRYTEG